MRLIVLAATWAALMGLWACAPTVARTFAAAAPALPPSVAISDTVYRVHDDAKGVTCYFFYLGHGGGISCLPDSELKKQ